MDQVSRPVLLALVGVVLFAGVWFTTLRPGAGGASDPTPAAAPTAPGQQGLESAVGDAQGAVRQSQQPAQVTEAAAGEDAPATAATPAAEPSTTPAKAKPSTTPAKAKAAEPAAVAAAADDPSKPLLAKLDEGKTVILLFWNPDFDDDRFAYKSVRRADEADGRVVAKSARIGDVSRYSAVTMGVNVLTTPTVVVIGPDRKAVSHTGYVERKTVEQLIGDSRRAR